LTCAGHGTPRCEFFFQWKETRYLIVGGANTLLGLSIIYLLKWIGGVGDVVANLAGYICGLIVSFILNASWTFAYKGNMVAALMKFVVVLLTAYLSNLVAVMTAISVLGVNSYIAQGMGIVPYTLVGYLGSRFFAFSGTGSSDRT
jgi:putative flippase GtrA